MPRYKKADIQASLDRMCRAFGLSSAEHNNGTGYAVDHYTIGGGYKVTKVTPQGGCADAFVGYRLPAPQFVQALQFAAAVGEQLQHDGAKIMQGAKPASMFDAKVISVVKRIVQDHPHAVLTIEDLRILRAWTGQ